MRYHCVVDPLSKFIKASRPFRARFGQMSGSWLWISMLSEKFRKPGELMRVRVPGVMSPVFLRAHTSDIEAFCQIFVHGELDEPTGREVRSIVDAGANIGLAAVFLANKYPQADVLALEVSEGNVSLLRMNVSGYPRIRQMTAGLWSHQTGLRIVNPDDAPWAFRVDEVPVGSPGAIPSIGVVDAARFFRSGFIDLLKMDIEGSELAVLNRDSDAWLPLVGRLMIELHDRFAPGCSEALDRAIARFSHRRTTRGEYHVIEFPQHRISRDVVDLDTV